jgi:hypothetical protein
MAFVSMPGTNLYPRPAQVGSAGRSIDAHRDPCIGTPHPQKEESMRRLVTRAMIAIATTAALLALPTAAHADSGDGSVYCNAGEICFSDAAGGTWTTGIKHFWYSANHRGYYFYGTGVPVVDHIGGYRNLDTQCSVFVWDVDGFGNWYVYSGLGTEYPAVTHTATYRGYSSGDQNRNNGHTRCQRTTHP